MYFYGNGGEIASRPKKTKYGYDGRRDDDGGKFVPEELNTYDIANGSLGTRRDPVVLRH